MPFPLVHSTCVSYNRLLNWETDKQLDIDVALKVRCKHTQNNKCDECKSCFFGAVNVEWKLPIVRIKFDVFSFTLLQGQKHIFLFFHISYFSFFYKPSFHEALIFLKINLKNFLRFDLYFFPCFLK